jgi:hypothetical protein
MALRSSTINLACRTASALLAKEMIPRAAVVSAPQCSPCKRCYSAAAVTTSHDTGNNNGAPYVSPFQGMFDRINEGKTFLGTTELKKPDIKHLKCGIPEFALRFKTTSYGRMLQEPFVSANEHRVTLQVPIKYLPLNEVELLVFKEIVGTRLNEEKGMLQLSSIQFGSRIENKRHVVSMLDRMVESAKSLSQRLEEADAAASNQSAEQ